MSGRQIHTKPDSCEAFLTYFLREAMPRREVEREGIAREKRFVMELAWLPVEPASLPFPAGPAPMPALAKAFQQWRPQSRPAMRNEAALKPTGSGFRQRHSGSRSHLHPPARR